MWPPPHRVWHGLKRNDRACWYWNRGSRVWSRERVYGFAYDRKEEAEKDLLIAAASVTPLTPGVEQLGEVRVSRQLVPLVRVDMSDI